MVKTRAVESNAVAAQPAEENALSTQRLLSESEYRNIGTIGDAIALFEEAFGLEIHHAEEELGDGFTPMTEADKRRLVGVPLFLIGWQFKVSETVTRNGEAVEYANVRVICERHGKTEKYVFADGGTGIYPQLKGYSERTGRMGGILAKNGLRASDYNYRDPATGDTTPATTYYIDLAGM